MQADPSQLIPQRLTVNFELEWHCIIMHGKNIQCDFWKRKLVTSILNKSDIWSLKFVVGG